MAGRDAQMLPPQRSLELIWWHMNSVYFRKAKASALGGSMSMGGILNTFVKKQMNPFCQLIKLRDLAPKFR